MSEKHLAEVRVCPQCLLAAYRVPALDTETQIAFQCHDRHPVFLVTPDPKPSKVTPVAATDVLRITDAPVLEVPRTAPKEK
jgi:hypothetical protein